MTFRRIFFFTRNPFLVDQRVDCAINIMINQKVDFESFEAEIGEDDFDLTPLTALIRGLVTRDPQKYNL